MMTQHLLIKSLKSGRKKMELSPPTKKHNPGHANDQGLRTKV